MAVRVAVALDDPAPRDPGPARGVRALACELEQRALGSDLPWQGPRTESRSRLLLRTPCAHQPRQGRLGRVLEPGLPDRARLES
jgi:hypothetical protein